MATDIKSAAMLLDLAKCTACRGCQAACKQWNDLPAEETINRGSYQNPEALSYDTYTLIHFEEHEKADGSLTWLFLNERCLHCTEAACVDSCPTGALAYNGMRGSIRYQCASSMANSTDPTAGTAPTRPLV